MTSIREATLSIRESEYAEMGLEELVTVIVDAGLLNVIELEFTGKGGLLQVEVECQLDRSALEELQSVTEWETLAETEAGYRYLIGFEAPNLPEEIVEYTTEMVGTCDLELDDAGMEMSVVGPQESIRGVLNAYLEAGVSPDLRKIGQYEGSENPMYALTRRQREVLQTAFEEGYYDVPREASTADVAAALDVDPSTVSEHLRRAERNLLNHHLSKQVSTA